MADTECLKISGYEFWVESDEKRMKQYRIQKTVEEGRNMISCYIASKPGAEFCVGIRKRKGSQSTLIRSYLNGDFVLQDPFRTSWSGDAYVSYLRKGNERRGFTFSAINSAGGYTFYNFQSYSSVHPNITEDELAEFAPVPRDLGTIKLEIIRIKNIRAIREVVRSPSYDIDMPSDTPTFSEKTKAENFHTILLQEPEEVESSPGFPTYYRCECVDTPEQTPWYTVKFLYRPIETLRAEGIAPALPSTSRANRAREREKKRLDQEALIKTESIKDESPEIPSSIGKRKTNNHRSTESQETIVTNESEEEDSKDLLGRTTPLIKDEVVETDKPLSTSLKRSRVDEPDPVPAKRTKQARRASNSEVIDSD